MSATRLEPWYPTCILELPFLGRSETIAASDANGCAGVFVSFCD
jgi:hypothetical protein